MLVHKLVGRFGLGIGTLALVASCYGAEAAPAGPTASAASRAVIDDMIAAHGGLEAWSSAPTVSFECRFLPAGTSSPIVSQEVIEQGARRAYIDYSDSDKCLAWDGERAWSESWDGPYPPRFIALLNYYFANLPWLTMDPGVMLDEPGTAKLWDDPTEYVTIKMTFEAGVGDTPDDYYVLYIDPTTHLLKACRYIVTYAGILPEGTESTDEHIFFYDEHETVNGLLVPNRCSIYELDRTLYASAELTGWSFSEPFDSSRMLMPEDAVVDLSDR